MPENEKTNYEIALDLMIKWNNDEGLNNEELIELRHRLKGVQNEVQQAIIYRYNDVLQKKE